MRRYLVLGVLGLVLASGAVWALPQVADELPDPLGELARWPERLWTRVVPARPSTTARLAGLTDPEREAARQLGASLDGRLVWSSNRSGNHELYLLDLRARSLRRLTDHPHVDFGSRFSPDGRQIVFMRSQRPWVSFREAGAWDIHLMDTEGRGERRIATGGYRPSWTADGTGVVFHRRDRVFRYDLATGTESEPFHGEDAIPGLARPGDFELSPDGRRLALAFRGPFSGAGVVDLGTRTLVPLTRVQACQTSWAPDGARLVWVENEGHGGTRVMTGQPDGADRRVLIDLPGAHSHEYFPKLANDGQWLVWGASAGGHEHDRADYEIFVWAVGTPPARALRLTHHEGSDQWPDLWLPPRR